MDIYESRDSRFSNDFRVVKTRKNTTVFLVFNNVFFNIKSFSSTAFLRCFISAESQFLQSRCNILQKVKFFKKASLVPFFIKKGESREYELIDKKESIFLIKNPKLLFE